MKLLFSTLLITLYFNLSAQNKGKIIFEQNCASCHNFKQSGIGPALGQLFTQVDETWVKGFILNPSGFKAKKDPRTLELLKSYAVIMPSFSHLPKSDIDNIIAYLKSEQRSLDPKKMPNKDGVSGILTKQVVKTSEKLIIKEVQTAPKTDVNIPISRINTMVVNDGKTFLSDQNGIIYNFSENNLEPYFDLKKAIPEFIARPGLASGIGSYAFHPEFSENGLFYTTHTEKASIKKADFTYNDTIKVALQWIITEWKTENPKSSNFNGKPREIIRINFVSQIHGMQEIAFNPFAKKGDPDYGNLYIALGDGGASENGFPAICDSPKNIYSSILRINPLGSDAKNGSYGYIKNKFKTQNSDFLPEIFARGFRNPNRFQFLDKNNLLVSEIGHHNIEELNLVKEGQDHGWPYREGTYQIKPEANMSQVYKVNSTQKQLYTDPLAQYDHTIGNAISGGFIYKGKNIPTLKNKYIFNDIVNGRVFYLDALKIKTQGLAPLAIKEFQIIKNNKVINFLDLSGFTKADLRIGQNQDNELFLYTKTDAKIYKIIGHKLK